MTKGKVKWYNEVKGYGFITQENGEEVFVHRSGLVSPFAGLEPDEEVMFEKKDGQRGPQAHNVKSAS